MTWLLHLEMFREADVARQAARADSRFVVMEVWCDGNPDDVTSFERLEDALDRRDQLREERPGIRGRGPLFLVCDREDPERGYLDWEHTYEEAATCS